MELFRKLNEVLPAGGSVNIVIGKDDDGRMTASVHSTIVLRGTPEEFDEAFAGAVIESVQIASGIADAARKGPAKKVVGNLPEVPAVPYAQEEAQKEAKPKASAKKAATPAPAQESAPAEQKAAEPAPEASAPAQQAEPEPQSATASEPQAPTAQEAAPAQEQPAQQTPAAPATKGIRELWAEGRELYKQGDYDGAYKDFEQCLAIASDNQKPKIRQAMDSCTKMMHNSLFGQEQ